MKITKIIRSLIIMTLTVALLTVGGIAASAESAEATEKTESEVITDTSETESNLFADIFAAIEDFSSEILSILAFSGSLLVAFAYKKGLLPAVKNGIGTIGNAVVQLKEATDGFGKHQDELLEAFNERLAAAEKVLEGFSKAIDEIAEKTDSVKDAAEERENVKALMSAQVDMLYEIFMTSSLPQYQKDSVSRRISEMKEVSELEKVEE